MDSRIDHLKKDLGIDWTDEPIPVEDPYAGVVTEQNTVNYHLASLEDEARAREQEQAMYERFSGMSAAQIEAEYKQKLAEQEHASLPKRQEEAARQFVLEAPEFALTNRNQQRMEQYAEAAGLKMDNPDDFHRAYKALASRGLIQIDESKRPRTPRQRLTTADLYEMPMEQLADLANTARRK